MGRREVILDTAIEVVYHKRMRGLTHRAVDDRAGLPAGATSNVFRTRAALVQGILERILERELAIWAHLSASAATIEDLSAKLTQLIDDLTSEHRSLTAARHAVIAEAAIDESMLAVAAAAGTQVIAWAEEQMAALGARDPRADGRILLALVDGLLAEAMAPTDQPLDTRRAVTALLRGLL